MEIIDISYDKCIDWLVNRHKLDKDWPKALAAVKASLQKAQLPDSLQGTDTAGLTYAGVVKIMSLLEKAKTAEGAKLKNFFGSYNDQQLQEWDSIVKAYQANNLYLAEAGKTMVHNTNYEIPALKKTVQQSGHQQDDLARKIREQRQSSAELLVKFQESCKSLALEPDESAEEASIAVSLRATAKDLPAAVKAVWELMQPVAVEHSITLYRAFVRFQLQQDNKSELTVSKLCSALETVRGTADGGDPCVLLDQATRHACQTDVLELLAFLRQRLKQVTNPQESVVAEAFRGPDVDPVLQQQNTPLLQGFLASLEALEAGFESERLQQLVMITTSDRYVQRLAGTVREPLLAARRTLRSAEANEKRRADLGKSAVQASKDLKEIRQTTTDLKAMVAAAISELCEGKQINLFGGVV